MVPPSPVKWTFYLVGIVEAAKQAVCGLCEGGDEMAEQATRGIILQVVLSDSRGDAQASSGTANTGVVVEARSIDGVSHVAIKRACYTRGGGWIA